MIKRSLIQGFAGFVKKC